MQFARPFMQGEIYRYPKVLLDGTLGTTGFGVTGPKTRARLSEVFGL